jgi:acetyl esterase/lipase
MGNFKVKSLNRIRTYLLSQELIPSTPMQLLRRISNLNLIKHEKELLEKYINYSLFLNALVICLTAIYELGFTFSFYGQIVGIFFILTFYSNLGLIYLNDKYMNTLIRNKHKLHLLVYGYLILAIITAFTLISIGLADIKRQTYNPFYYILFCYAFLISYIDYKQFNFSEENISDASLQFEKNKNALKVIMFILILLTAILAGIFLYNLFIGGIPSGTYLLLSYMYPILYLLGLILLISIIPLLIFRYKWTTTRKPSLSIFFVKSILIILSLLVFIFAGMFAFNILSGGAPLHSILYLINFLFPAFFPLLILILPTTTLLLYKIFPVQWVKFSKSLSVIGLMLTCILALPYFTAPISMIDANNQFADVFGRKWNTENPEEFLDMQHVLIQSWFGEPDLDPESWEVDHDIVYKETDDYRLKFDVYYPGAIAAQYIGEKATIIFIHGGSWSSRDRSDGAAYLKYFAAQGYVGFSIEYRLLELDGSPKKSYVGDYNIEDMMEDVANFTHYLALNEGGENLHGADLDEVFLVGQSAGAHLAALTGFGYNDDEWGLHQRLKIKGTVLFYPPDDARRIFGSGTFYNEGMSKYKTPEDDPGFYDLYTPSELVDKKDPACLIIQGTSDTYVPYKDAEAIKRACEREDVDVILITSYFSGHAHDISVLVKTMSLYYIERYFYLIKED